MTRLVYPKILKREDETQDTYDEAYSRCNILDCAQRNYCAIGLREAKELEDRTMDD